MSNFRELRVWQRGMDLVEQVYGFTKTLPGDERYGLCTQLQRASVSIPSNTAEGHSRQRLGAYINHVTIAIGSAAEIETLFEACRRLGFGDAKQLAACEACLADVANAVWAASLSRAIVRRQKRTGILDPLGIARPLVFLIPPLRSVRSE